MDVKTTPVKIHLDSLLKSINITDITTTSVKINFDVIKNNQDGNVVIKDKSGNEIEKKNGINGKDSITIEGLESNTTFSGWTIEVDGNDPETIKDFTTLPLESKVSFSNVSDITTNSVIINFNVEKNDGDGNVLIKNKTRDIKGNKNNIDGKTPITIEGLKSNRTFSGWTIEVDGSDPEIIDDFETKKLQLTLKTTLV